MSIGFHDFQRRGRRRVSVGAFQQFHFSDFIAERRGWHWIQKGDRRVGLEVNRRKSTGRGGGERIGKVGRGRGR